MGSFGTSPHPAGCTKKSCQDSPRVLQITSMPAKDLVRSIPRPSRSTSLRTTRPLWSPTWSVICDRSKLSDRGCEGAPDFIVEVTSPSNPNMDYISKLSLYRDAGVREYWICDPQRERTRVFVFDPGSTYQELPFGETVSSTVLPGFTISFAQIVADM